MKTALIVVVALAVLVALLWSPTSKLLNGEWREEHHSTFRSLFKILEEAGLMIVVLALLVVAFVVIEDIATSSGIHRGLKFLLILVICVGLIRIEALVLSHLWTAFMASCEPRPGAF